LKIFYSRNPEAYAQLHKYEKIKGRTIEVKYNLTTCKLIFTLVDFTFKRDATVHWKVTTN